MQPARVDRRPPASALPTSVHKEPSVPQPNAVQAAAYIHDMTSTMRNLAAQHKLTTLALLLEMAAVEAGSMRAP